MPQYQSGQSFGDRAASSASDFGDVFASEGVLVLDLHFVDLISADLLSLQCVHQIYLH